MRPDAKPPGTFIAVDSVDNFSITIPRFVSSCVIYLEKGNNIIRLEYG